MSDIFDIYRLPSIAEAINAHAAAAFPNEACALLVAGENGPEAILADNLADKYHALDPEAFPRTAATAYVLDPRLIMDAEARGQRLVAIVHSHCRVGAYFSDEDVRQAMSPFDDGPLYPGVDYLVLDVQQDGVRGFKVYRWDPGEERFAEAREAA